MKRILSVQDISCVGKCSLTVALPILSSMGIETAIIPTAVLSTHTAFKGFTFCDLTSEITPICNHWKEQTIDFDAIYTGYLGSVEQIDLVIDIFRSFGKDKLKFADPAMADNGKLYAGFDNSFPKEMARVCAEADVIVPNVTEACLMLDIPYRESGYGEDYIRDILIRLCGLGCKCAVVTGVDFGDGNLGSYGYDSEKDEFFSDFNKKIDLKFHGTGDVFSSVCVGGIMRGLSLHDSISLAADFVCDSILATVNDERPITYGVHFEKEIPTLCRKLEELS